MLFQLDGWERKKINLGLNDLLKIYSEECRCMVAWFDTENTKNNREKEKNIK
jgi:hypothetical protein